LGAGGNRRGKGHRQHLGKVTEGRGMIRPLPTPLGAGRGGEGGGAGGVRPQGQGRGRAARGGHGPSPRGGGGRGKAVSEFQGPFSRHTPREAPQLSLPAALGPDHQSPNCIAPDWIPSGCQRPPNPTLWVVRGGTHRSRAWWSVPPPPTTPPVQGGIGCFRPCASAPQPTTSDLPHPPPCTLTRPDGGPWGPGLEVERLPSATPAAVPRWLVIATTACRSPPPPLSPESTRSWGSMSGVGGIPRFLRPVGRGGEARRARNRRHMAEFSPHLSRNSTSEFPHN